MVVVLLVNVQKFYCTNTREYTNSPSCSGKRVFVSPRLQEGICIYTRNIVQKSLLVIVFVVGPETIVYEKKM